MSLSRTQWSEDEGRGGERERERDREFVCSFWRDIKSSNQSIKTNHKISQLKVRHDLVVEKSKLERELVVSREVVNAGVFFAKPPDREAVKQRGGVVELSPLLLSAPLHLLGERRSECGPSFGRHALAVSPDRR